MSLDQKHSNLHACEATILMSHVCELKKDQSIRPYRIGEWGDFLKQRLPLIHCRLVLDPDDSAPLMTRDCRREPGLPYRTLLDC